MTSGWRQPYAQLKEFVSEHPEIEIGEKIVRIPEAPRAQFYVLFDKIGSALLHQDLPDIFPETARLAKSFSEAKGELSTRLGMVQISASHGLERFLDDPQASLMAELFDLTLDLVKGRASPEAFEDAASRKADAFSQRFYRMGYEKWVEMSVTGLLDPDRVLCVPLPKISIVKKFKTMSPLKHKVPRPKDKSDLILEREVFPIFTTPDFIVHSARLRKFASLATEIVDPAWGASNASRRRKWYQVAPIRAELAASGGWPDISVYVSRWASDLSLVTDTISVARPDLIIECNELEERREQDIEKAKLEHRVLKPKLGTFIVSRGLVSKKEGTELGDGIRLLAVGFDRTKLRPIVEALSGSKKARRSLSS